MSVVRICDVKIGGVRFAGGFDIDLGREKLEVVVFNGDVYHRVDLTPQIESALQLRVSGRCTARDEYGNQCERPTPHLKSEHNSSSDHFACARSFKVRRKKKPAQKAD